MRKYLIVLAMSLFVQTNISFGQSSDANLNALLGINDSLYLNKPLDSIILVLPQGYTCLKIYGIRNTARLLSICYPNKVWIELHVRQFLNMNPVDPNRVWNISLIKLEPLHHISIYKGSDCFKGCPDN
jgi:hypothetical protein